MLGLGGGDGFALVIHGGAGDALGERGNHLGYGGIPGPTNTRSSLRPHTLVVASGRIHA